MATVISVEEAKRRSAKSPLKSPFHLDLMELPIDQALVVPEIPIGDVLGTIWAVGEERLLHHRLENLTDGTQGMVVWFEEA